MVEMNRKENNKRDYSELSFSNESNKIWSKLVLESSSTLELPKWIKT